MTRSLRRDHIQPSDWQTQSDAGLLLVEKVSRDMSKVVGGASILRQARNVIML